MRMPLFGNMNVGAFRFEPELQVFAKQYYFYELLEENK